MKRFFRFRLRTLLILITALSLYLGWHVHSTERQKAAVGAIRNLGGWVYYNYQIGGGKYDPKAVSFAPEWLRRSLGNDFFHDVVQVNLVYNVDGPHRLENNQTTDTALEFVAQLPRVELVLLKGGQATDQGLQRLRNLRHLRRIYMWDASKVTDAGIAELRQVPNLEYVHCDNSRLTDESLCTFGMMPQLEGLSLQGNHFTDEGLAHLSRLTKLKSLWIGMGSTQITDDGLTSIRSMKQLKELDVQESPVTVDALVDLLDVNPNLKIYHGLNDGNNSAVAQARAKRGH